MTRELVRRITHGAIFRHPDAACLDADAELFYPNGQGGDETMLAKRICNGTDSTPPCPVRDACLDHALEHREVFGVWGGTDERQRRLMITRVRRRRAS